jgi:poly-gamma-glutamate synthesis protein (capsule biosynthesis protein)
MRWLLVITLFIICGLPAISQENKTLSFLFMGDIMGHDSQIKSAKVNDSVYDYTCNYQYLKPLISSVDVAIANLEVTLAGPPHKGYPQFSSPDAIADACKNAGIDILGTANNHSMDRGQKGLIRTLDVLDKKGIPHFGTYRDLKEKETHSPLFIDKNGIKVALINATYGTNGIPVKPPVIVDLIDYKRIKKEVEKAQQKQVDKIIVLIHWGKEYLIVPSEKQEKMAESIFKLGVDIIIGSHPHVIQRSEWDKQQDRLICYSLGNFISNQRKLNTDGGQMFRFTLAKDSTGCKIAEAGHFLTWVHTPWEKNGKKFYILPCAEFELQPDFFPKDGSYTKMTTYISNARNNLNTNNKEVFEFLFVDGNWESVVSKGGE